MTRLVVRLALACVAVLFLGLSAGIVWPSGPSSSNDCLARIGQLILLGVWTEYAFTLAKRSRQVWEDDALPESLLTHSNPQLASVSVQIRQDADRISRTIGIIIASFALAGISSAILGSFLHVTEGLTLLFHGGPDTEFIITANPDLASLSFGLLIIAAAMIICESITHNIAQAHPIAWQEVKSSRLGGGPNIVVCIAVVGVVSFALTAGCVDSYARFGSEGVRIGSFPNIGKQYEWSSITAVRQLNWYGSRPTKTGRVRTGPYYRFQLLFSDGSQWRSSAAEVDNADIHMNKDIEPAISYACRRSGCRIEQLWLDTQ